MVPSYASKKTFPLQQIDPQIYLEFWVGYKPNFSKLISIHPLRAQPYVH